MHDRDQVARRLTGLLGWELAKAVQFVGDVATEQDCEDILAHIRGSETPRVGVAAVVYRIRMRAAGGNLALKRLAAAEAGEHHALIRPRRASVNRSDAKPPSQPRRAHKVAEWHHDRRRETDTH